MCKIIIPKVITICYIYYLKIDLALKDYKEPSTDNIVIYNYVNRLVGYGWWYMRVWLINFSEQFTENSGVRVIHLFHTCQLCLITKFMISFLWIKSYNFIRLIMIRNCVELDSSWVIISCAYREGIILEI